jgi:hypothetical protein
MAAAPTTRLRSSIARATKVIALARLENVAFWASSNS